MCEQALVSDRYKHFYCRILQCDFRPSKRFIFLKCFQSSRWIALNWSEKGTVQTISLKTSGLSCKMLVSPAYHIRVLYSYAAGSKRVQLLANRIISMLLNSLA